MRVAVLEMLRFRQSSRHECDTQGFTEKWLRPDNSQNQHINDHFR